MLNKTKLLAIVTALSLLGIGGAPTATVQAVATSSESSEVRQSFEAEWVKHIDQELQTPQLNWTFLYDPRDPRSAMLNTLNQAAEALDQQNLEKAKELVNKTFTILEEGHRLGYYPPRQFEAVSKAIKQHLPNSLT